MTNELNQADTDFWNDLETQEYKRRGIKKHNSQEHKLLEKLIDESSFLDIRENDIIRGKYLGVKSNQHCFYVEGLKDEIRVNVSANEDKYLKNSEIGEDIDVLITLIDEDDFQIFGSISEIYENKAHELLKSLDESIILMAEIKSMNPAGYAADLFYEGVTLSGFMPNTLAGINKLYNPEVLIGKTLEVSIESYSKDEGTYIVSRRKYLRSLIPKAIEELQTNVIYQGNVTGTTPFGIFVEFNECLTGMIHKANVDPDWQDKLLDIKPGFEIQFYVKEINKGKIILTQILRESLWDTARIGQIIDGKVKETKSFGTLVFLDAETMGLIHNSELGKLNRKFDDGQEVQVKIIAIDRPNRKIFLTVS